VMEEQEMDEQSCFRANRGAIDGLFTTSISLQKCKERNLETRVMFVDLVKACNPLPQEALFAVLRPNGLPNHFFNDSHRSEAFFQRLPQEKTSLIG
jgi:hypothetical protein